MTLYDKIIALYPSLTEGDFDPIKGTILLQNDGNGDYVKTWTNSNPQPTQDELNSVTKG
jgi:hypothetical protein